MKKFIAVVTDRETNEEVLKVELKDESEFMARFQFMGISREKGLSDNFKYTHWVGTKVKYNKLVK